MARPARTDGKNNVTLHLDKGHRYASTQPYTLDPVTGKKRYSRVHWGTVTDDLKFLPNFKLENSPEVWDTLDFPPDWDLSAMDELRTLHGGTEVVHIDLTHTIADGDLPFSGDPPTVVRQWSSLESDHFRLKSLSFGSHSGTHMDSPSHLLAGGKTLDRYAPCDFFTKAYALDVRGECRIDKDLVETVPSQVTAVLFCTGWHDRWNSDRYFEDPPLLTEEATTFLLQRGVRLFGFESSSCDALGSESLPIHHLIFSYEALILENLNSLDRVVGKTFSLIALPLRIEEGDGSPSRVIASYAT